MKIAVVTATFQRQDGTTPEVLKRALNSLNLQAHQDWKLFLIGDAYPDQDEFNSYKKYLPEDKIYIENQPISVERERYPKPSNERWCVSGITPVNIGIKRALEEGYDYVALLDHDDVWYSDHLQLINEGIEQTKSPFIFTRGYYSLVNPETNKKQTVGIPYVNFVPEKFKELTVNQDNPFRLNYGIQAFPCYPTDGIFLKTSVCLNCRVITLRMRDSLQETGHATPGDGDWWLRIREEMINKKYQPALYIDHITCVNIDEGYSKTKT